MFLDVFLSYLIKERIVSTLDSCSVSLAAHMNLHHRFDVVARQLSGLNDTNTDLEDSPKKVSNYFWPNYANKLKIYTLWLRPV